MLMVVDSCLFGDFGNVDRGREVGGVVEGAAGSAAGAGDAGDIGEVDDAVATHGIILA